MILPHALILPVSQLQTQQTMMSQIRSHMDYSIQTLSYHFVIAINEKSSLNSNLMYD